MSQPPLSRQIRNLEVELGVKLLDRNRQGVRLTPFGNATLTRARALLRNAELFKGQVKVLGEQIQEQLQIGYAPSPTALIISRVLAKYHVLAPGGRLTLHDLTHTEMLLKLKTKKLEAALTLRPNSKELRGLRFEMVSRHAVGIVCSLNHPLTAQSTVRPSAVANNELIVYRAQDFPEYHKWIARILGAKPDELIIAHECDDVLGVIAAAESGPGVAIVGEFITAVAGNRVRFIPFASKAHFLEVGLLYSLTGLAETTKKLIAACAASKAMS
jgi:DNA-binding transcriptional LysR family regulator